ncbi:hypothetical protein EJ08DRAFT_724521 [Tothia fuscella]|uniref:Uncharacterized protein n=1 Tax=Tothia fuscella TaxID=1048955 RepID=A0A9P4NJJ8_9PEZI|nr:hypothetical protein EJ08DRAFT_724521 [Tothia fuscella]
MSSGDPSRPKVMLSDSNLMREESWRTRCAQLANQVEIVSVEPEPFKGHASSRPNNARFLMTDAERLHTWKRIVEHQWLTKTFAGEKLQKEELETLGELLDDLKSLEPRHTKVHITILVDQEIYVETSGYQYQKKSRRAGPLPGEVWDDLLEVYWPKRVNADSRIRAWQDKLEEPESMEPEPFVEPTSSQPENADLLIAKDKVEAKYQQLFLQYKRRMKAEERREEKMGYIHF